MFAFHRIFITIYPNTRSTLYTDSKCSLTSRNFATCLIPFSQLIQNDQLHKRLSILRKKRLRYCICLKKKHVHERQDKDSLKPCFKDHDSKAVQVKKGKFSNYRQSRLFNLVGWHYLKDQEHISSSITR